MSKGYAMMLEATIQNLRKDNLILKEQNSKYRELEEQLGCPLDVVVKALQTGVYYEDVANCMKYMVVDLHFNLEGDFVLYFEDGEYLLVRNYKKTWWLKKDKSE